MICWRICCSRAVLLAAEVASKRMSKLLQAQASRAEALSKRGQANHFTAMHHDAAIIRIDPHDHLQCLTLHLLSLMRSEADSRAGSTSAVHLPHSMLEFQMPTLPERK